MRGLLGQRGIAGHCARAWPGLRRHAVRFLAGLGVVLVVSAVVGADAGQHLSAGGYQYRDAATQRAVDVLASDFRVPADANLILTVHDRSTVRSGPVAAAGKALVARVRSHPAVALTTDPWTSPASSLFSKDGRTALVLVQISGSERAAAAAARHLAEEVTHTEGLIVGAGGQALVQDELIHSSQDALLRAELLALPLAFLALMMAFRSLAAALLPVAVGAVAVTAGLALLRLLTLVVPVGTFALNLTTALGFGLAVDYSLFLLTRYRGERAAGRDRDQALDITTRTAGRTVIYSALAIGAALVALLFFPVYALSSLAYVALSVVAIAAVSAVIVVVCTISVLGHRGDRFLLRRPRPHRPRPQRARSDGWGRLAASATSHPWQWAVPLVVVLCALAAPFAHASFTVSDERMMRDTSPVRAATEQARAQFDLREVDPVWLLLPPGVEEGEAAAYTRAVARIRGVALATALTASGPGGRTAVRAVTIDAPDSDAAADTLARLRELAPPGPVSAVGGTADRVNTLNALSGRLPWALGLMAAGTFVLLFLFTGSVLLPVKALFLAGLSLTAGMGVLVTLFQDGNAAFLLGEVTAPGYLDPSVVIVIICVCFGLATDYEMFLLSRVREQYLLTRDIRTAAVEGTRQTAGTISWSAIILITVLLALAASPLSVLKMVGIGCALSVLVDAFVIRPILVPAALALFGPANWWAPPWMRRLHERISPHEPPPASPRPLTPLPDHPHSTTGNSDHQLSAPVTHP
jgi:RND superfamily putative drug exporter